MGISVGSTISFLGGADTCVPVCVSFEVLVLSSEAAFVGCSEETILIVVSDGGDTPGVDATTL